MKEFFLDWIDPLVIGRTHTIDGYISVQHPRYEIEKPIETGFVDAREDLIDEELGFRVRLPRELERVPTVLSQTPSRREHSRTECA